MMDRVELVKLGHRIRARTRDLELVEFIDQALRLTRPEAAGQQERLPAPSRPAKKRRAARHNKTSPGA